MANREAIETAMTRSTIRDRRTSERRPLLVVGVVVFFALSVSVLAVMANSLPFTIWGRSSGERIKDGESQAYSAKLVRETETGERCSNRAFDNRTGRLIETSERCEKTVVDDKGLPVPVGTVRRLDAINKSFYGR
jgi:hypothetical protein